MPHSQAELELLSFNTGGILSAIRQSAFPNLTAEVSHLYCVRPTLASISKINPERYVISLHSILNTHKTPEYVIRHILIHELIHIEIPPRDLIPGEDDPRLKEKRRGKRDCPPLGPISHPPEFWERESGLSPERESAMGWIIEQLWSFIKLDSQAERIEVKPNWRSWVWEGSKTRKMLKSISR